MNQNTLIRLEKEAEKMVLQIPASLDCEEFTSLFNEKFAELIVRECVKAADEWYQYHNEIQWDPGEHIKQHFGVEE